MKRSFLILLISTLLVVLVAVPTMATLPVEIGGSLFTELKYTPEELWKGGSGLAFWSNMETDQAKVNLDIIWSDGYGDGDGFIWFSSHDKPSFNFDVNTVTVTVDAPLLNSDKTDARVTMGDFAVNYSKWIGTLTEDHWRTGSLDKGENHSRGIAIENFKLDLEQENIDPITLAAFHSWYGGENEVFYGFFADTVISGFGTTLSAMRYNNRPVVLKDDGNSEYGESTEWENGVELFLSGSVHDDVFMDLTTVYWGRMTPEEEELSAVFNRAQFDWYNEQVGDVYFEVYNMGEDFAPRFYKHDYDDDATSEIEEYLDRVGTGAKASVTFNNDLIDVVDLSVGTDLYNLANDNIPDIFYNESWLRADKNFAGNEVSGKVAVKSVFDTEAYHKYHEYNNALLYGRVLSPVVREDGYDVDGRVLGKYSYDISSTDSSFILDGNLEATLHEGLFEGLVAYFGVQKDLQDSEGEFKPYLGMNYTTPGEIEIGVRYSADDLTAVEFDELSDTEDKAETYVSIKKTVEF